MSSCAASRADGVCDSACNVASCGFDGGDCDVDGGLTWGGYELAEHIGFDGLAKGGAGAIVSGASVTMLSCVIISNHADVGGAFYVQGCRADRSNDAPCDADLMSSSSRLTLQNSTSIANVGGSGGGLIYATIGAVITIISHTSDADGAVSEGGVLRASQGSVCLLYTSPSPRDS